MQEKLEDIKEVIRNRKSKKDRKLNGQKNKDKRTSNDLQNTTQKTKDRATRTLLKILHFKLQFAFRLLRTLTSFVYDTAKLRISKESSHLIF